MGSMRGNWSPEVIAARAAAEQPLREHYRNVVAPVLDAGVDGLDTMTVVQLRQLARGEDMSTITRLTVKGELVTAIRRQREKRAHGSVGAEEALEPVYVASVNVPGYLPMNDPVGFAGAQEAGAWLRDERQRDEDANPDPMDTGEYSDYWRTLDYIASGVHGHGRRTEDTPTAADGTGHVHADTPGRDPDDPHDLGLVYAVSLLDHEDYPHEAGYLFDCMACEAMCHCAPGAAQCVYGGDHDYPDVAPVTESEPSGSFWTHGPYMISRYHPYDTRYIVAQGSWDQAKPGVVILTQVGIASSLEDARAMADRDFVKEGS